MMLLFGADTPLLRESKLGARKSQFPRLGEPVEERSPTGWACPRTVPHRMGNVHYRPEKVLEHTCIVQPTGEYRVEAGVPDEPLCDLLRPFIRR